MKLMHEHRLERVLVVDGDWQLKGLVTVKDILKETEHPNACKDPHGKLRVGAAVGVVEGTEERVEALVEGGADVLIVDTAHGHAQGRSRSRAVGQEENIRAVEVIGGNVGRGDGAKALVDHGADGVKGRNRAGLYLHYANRRRGRRAADHRDPERRRCAREERLSRSVADGGIRYSGDIAKALAAGAHAVMLGSLFAGTDESPGDIELYQGRSYKSYRGMGSSARCARAQADRYFQDSEMNVDKLVPEGVEGRVAYKGSAGLGDPAADGRRARKHGIHRLRNLEEMRKKAEFVEITQAGIRESHVHDVQIVKEAPNYRVE
jgi:IMP dehydrogenase